ncbi:MAG: C4-dicarboxylate ABC transporter permease [Firmicutes bacterium]|nr:C4-dicarboxylate ABC transporter permease [Bacillota bacterium]
MSALLQIISDPLTISLLIGGTALGIAIGAMPGLTVPMGLALIISFTYVLEPVPGLAMLMGMYCGAVYGGSITAILINVPGTPAAMLTAVDGNRMALKGEAGKALGIVTISSFAGGIISAVALIVAAPLIGQFALRFGPQEYFAVGVMGLSIVAGLSRNNIGKGIMAALIGLLIPTIGLDPITSIPRFTFGNTNLLTGFEFIPMMIGIFGFRELLIQAGKQKEGHHLLKKVTRVIPTWKDLKDISGITLIGSTIGTLIGALPGAGGPIASFLSYDTASRLNKKLEFGTGIKEGVAASECANNAVTGGALIPLLSLGIPGDAAVAIMFGTFLMHGLTPGPTLFVKHPDIVEGIYASLILGNIVMLLIGLGCAKYIARISNVPLKYLLPVIASLCIIGSYSPRNSIFDVGVMVAFGIAGYLLSNLGVPMIPLVLGIVLSPIIEQNLRAALIVNKGNLLDFFTRPISGTVLALTVLFLIWPVLAKGLASIARK